MEKITTIGLDLAKHMFQVHGIDAGGQVMVRRQLRRGELLKFFEKQPPCLVGMEACGTSHYWAREIAALGHTVKMMPPAYVKPYVKRGKTDAADAEAICEAVTRPTMRFVPTKTIEQQSVLMLHKTRDLLIKQRTMLTNALRSHLAEFGVISAQGPAGLQPQLPFCTTCRISGQNWHALRCMGWSISCVSSGFKSRSLKAACMPGTATTRQAGALPRVPASGRSPPAPS
jgi:transposase